MFQADDLTYLVASLSKDIEILFDRSTDKRGRLPVAFNAVFTLSRLSFYAVIRATQCCLTVPAAPLEDFFPSF